jgi:Tol biopolymer transport system component
LDLDASTAVGDVEEFAFSRDGQPFREVDFNVWGVTFAPDSDRFYATLASKGVPYLIEGSVSKRSARVVAEQVECPSVSPDGTRVAFKRRMKETGTWRLHAMDLSTKRTWPLAEPRNVDDQVEWLDGEHVLYGIVADRGSPAEAMNVWRVGVAPDAPPPALFVHSASSPSAVR